MNKLNNRVKLYNSISSILACIDTKKLKQILSNGKSLHQGIGGTSVLIEVDNLPVFVKNI